jgi:hypothetical protein
MRRTDRGNHGARRTKSGNHDNRGVGRSSRITGQYRGEIHGTLGASGIRSTHGTPMTPRHALTTYTIPLPTDKLNRHERRQFARLGEIT